MSATTPEITKMQQTDHDTLIRVETKIEGLILEVKQSNENINSRVTEHEARLRTIEAIHEKTDPLVSYATLNSLVAWRSSIKSNWKLLVLLASFISGVVGFIAAWATLLYHVGHLTK